MISWSNLLGPMFVLGLRWDPFFFVFFFNFDLVFSLCLSIFAAPVIKSPYTLLISFL